MDAAFKIDNQLSLLAFHLFSQIYVTMNCLTARDQEVFWFSIVS